MKTAAIQAALVQKFRMNTDDGIKNALEYAAKQIGEMKSQFKNMFDELDKLIAQKYDELEATIKDQKTKEQELEKSRKILAWIEHCKEEVESVLDI